MTYRQRTAQYLGKVNPNPANARYASLRRLREKADASLDQIAFETGLSIGYLSRIERGFIPEIGNSEKRRMFESCLSRLEREANKE